VLELAVSLCVGERSYHRPATWGQPLPPNKLSQLLHSVNLSREGQHKQSHAIYLLEASGDCTLSTSVPPCSRTSRHCWWHGTRVAPGP